jgi:hypothetical protein
LLSVFIIFTEKLLIKIKKMKKLFTILTVVAISTTMTFAQQGTVAIGVGSNLADVSWQNYSLTPTVGYFINDNMMVGTGFIMSTETDNYNSVDPSGNDITVETKLSGMSLSPFFRYYINDAFFGQAGIVMTSVSDSDGDDEDKTSTFGIQAGVGYSLMWNDKVCIEPYIGLQTSSGSSESKTGNITVSVDAPSTFNMGIGLSIHIRLGGE